MSVNNAISLANAAHDRIGSAIIRARNAAPLTPEEEAASHKARLTAMSSLNSTIALVQSTLYNMEKANAAKEMKQGLLSTPSVEHELVQQTPSAVAFAATLSSPVEKVKQQMSAEGLKSSTQTLAQMAQAIEPIIDNFDQVLVSKLTPSSLSFLSKRCGNVRLYIISLRILHSLISMCFLIRLSRT
jgi:hypothetical protein